MLQFNEICASVASMSCIQRRLPKTKTEVTRTNFAKRACFRHLAIAIWNFLLGIYWNDSIQIETQNSLHLE